MTHDPTRSAQAPRAKATDHAAPPPLMEQLIAIETHVSSIRAFLTKYPFEGPETPPPKRALLASAFRTLHDAADECDAALMRTLVERQGLDGGGMASR